MYMYMFIIVLMYIYMFIYHDTQYYDVHVHVAFLVVNSIHFASLVVVFIISLLRIQVFLCLTKHVSINKDH